MNSIEIITVEQEQNLENKIEKPNSTVIKVENIPQELKDRKAWCIWKYELADGKWTKVPFVPYSQKWAKSNNKDTWSTFEDVIEFYQTGQGRKFDGIGTFLDVGIVGIDVDVDVEDIKNEVLQIGSYVEMSPSGKGIRSFVLGQLPTPPEGFEIYKKLDTFEMYSDFRFLTVTGHKISDSKKLVENQEGINAIHAKHLGLKPQKTARLTTNRITSDNYLAENNEPCLNEVAIFDACVAAKNGEKFLNLYNGNWEQEGYPSQSEGDQALCNMVGFFCGEYMEVKDYESAYLVINSIFRDSKLYRDKWERHDYQSNTINNAINSHIDGKYCSLKLNDDDAKLAEIITPIEGRYKEISTAYNFDNNLEKYQAREATKSNYKFEPLNSKTFFNTEYKFEWLIKGVMVSDQICIVGGPKKSMKTNTLIDMVISIATGGMYLGKFQATKKKVCLVSGESGEKTIQETAIRICKEKGINPEDLDVMWDFRLPKLSIDQELNELSQGLKRNGIEVVVIDPLYLCLLAGSENKNASSVYDMGELLAKIRDACEGAGCQLILCHHTKKSTINIERLQPLDLEDLAFAGVGEFARQWILINRREKYGYDGDHKLWFVAGGSAGHSCIYGLDIFEGTINDDFAGRVWDVNLLTLEEIQSEKAASKENDTQTDYQQIIDIIKRFSNITVESIKSQSDKECKDRGRKKNIGIKPIKTMLQELVNSQVIIKTTGKTVGGHGAMIDVAQYNVNKEHKFFAENMC